MNTEKQIAENELFLFRHKWDKAGICPLHDEAFDRLARGESTIAQEVGKRIQEVTAIEAPYEQIAKQVLGRVIQPELLEHLQTVQSLYQKMGEVCD